MITLDRLTKRYGDTTAVDDLSLRVDAGRVTGFLGPNGAGKSTTLRMLVGLDRPTSGRALIDGRRYADLADPVRQVGALLDPGAVHPGRSARAHLVAMARSHRIPIARVDGLLGEVGLEPVARDRVGTFSLGMRQRLGIAGALLGDPPVLLFDEPVNGLDPDGVRWIRRLLRRLAAEGRTVFVSSHLMSEMEDTADHLVVIGRGALIADAPVAAVITGGATATVVVRGPDAGALAQLRDRLVLESVEVRSVRPGGFIAAGATAERVGDLAYEVGVGLHELREQRASLEEAYMGLTDGTVRFAAPAAAATSPDAS